MIDINRLAIWTPDLYVNLHIDDGDEVSPTVFETTIEGVEHISKSNLAVPCGKD